MSLVIFFERSTKKIFTVKQIRLAEDKQQAEKYMQTERDRKTLAKEGFSIEAQPQKIQFRCNRPLIQDDNWKYICVFSRLSKAEKNVEDKSFEQTDFKTVLVHSLDRKSIEKIELALKEDGHHSKVTISKNWEKLPIGKKEIHSIPEGRSKSDWVFEGVFLHPDFPIPDAPNLCTRVPMHFQREFNRDKKRAEKAEKGEDASDDEEWTEHQRKPENKGKRKLEEDEEEVLTEVDFPIENKHLHEEDHVSDSDSEHKEMRKRKVFSSHPDEAPLSKMHLKEEPPRKRKEHDEDEPAIRKNPREEIESIDLTVESHDESYYAD